MEEPNKETMKTKTLVAHDEHKLQKEHIYEVRPDLLHNYILNVVRAMLISCQSIFIVFACQVCDVDFSPLMASITKKEKARLKAKLWHGVLLCITLICL